MPKKKNLRKVDEVEKHALSQKSLNIVIHVYFLYNTLVILRDFLPCDKHKCSTDMHTD